MYLETDELILEITRRCNLRCDHCCRGEAEALDMPREVIENTLDKINAIGTVTFTGGEPTLAPHVMADFLEVAREKKVQINNFYVVVNGTQAPDYFLRVVTDLFLFCDSDYDLEEQLSLEVSNTEWHDDHQDKNAIRKLMMFKFSRKRGRLEYKMGHLKYAGRAKAHHLASDDNKPSTYLVKEPLGYMDDGYRIEGSLYISAKGDIIAGCDHAYEDHVCNQDYSPDGSIVYCCNAQDYYHL